MSDVDWMNQTKQRMLPIFRDRVFHRPQLISEATRYAGSTTSPKLIIIDESHIATKPGMTVHSFISILAGSPITQLITPQILIDANISILAVSATPGDILTRPLTTWDSLYHKVVTITPPPTYHGIHHMLKHKRIYKSMPLTDETFTNTLIHTMLHAFNTPRYHIFRQNPTYDIYDAFSTNHSIAKQFSII